MRVTNSLQMNDWEIKKFLKVVLGIQLAMWGTIGLECLGLQIPLIRQFIGFIYLTFVPGFLILRILKLHKLEVINVILYTVGLSIAFLLFVGLFINTLYPYFGVSKPISLFPIMVTLTMAITVLCVLAYKIDKSFSNPVTHIDIKSLLSPPALFLMLLPFFAIFGTYLVNFYNNNVLLMILIPVIALIPILIAFDRFIPRKLYPLAIFVIAISLLYHNSLFSMHLVEWADLSWEYYSASTVLANFKWNPNIYGNMNTCLSINILAPFFTIVCNLNLVWVFKIIYPLIFSIVPLGIYCFVRPQANRKIAFLSSFLFMSMYTFYTAMLGLARQQIAEIFLALVLLLLVGNIAAKQIRLLLAIVFASSIVMSHYGLSSIFLLIVVGASIVLVFLNLHAKNQCRLRVLNSTFVMFYVVFILAWHMYLSSSSTLISVTNIGNTILKNFTVFFLNPEATQGLGILIEKTTAVGSIHKALHLATQFFIVVAVLTSLINLVKWKKSNFAKEYLALSVPTLGMLIAGIIVPYFASTVNTERLYHMGLLLLSPFSVVGGIWVFGKLSKLVKRIIRRDWLTYQNKYTVRTLSIFFSIYLLFNCGVINQIAGTPSSTVLNVTDPKLRRTNFNNQDIFAAKLLNDVTKGGNKIYADKEYAHLFTMYRGDYLSFKGEEKVITPLLPDTYIFFGTNNVKNERLRLSDPKSPRLKQTIVSTKTSKFYNDVLNNNKIYNNGNSEIFHIFRLM